MHYVEPLRYVSDVGKTMMLQLLLHFRDMAENPYQHLVSVTVYTIDLGRFKFKIILDLTAKASIKFVFESCI